MKLFNRLFGRKPEIAAPQNHAKAYTDDRGGYIVTYTGRKFHPLDPTVDEIDIVDIAHALPMLCRFTGHIYEFHSVGEHSIRVMHHFRETYPDTYGTNKKYLRTALLHDATETYLSDLARPVKWSADMAGYRVAEARLEEVIARKFDLIFPTPKIIKDSDEVLLAWEARDLHPGFCSDWEHHQILDKVPSYKLIPLEIKAVQKLFLEEFSKLQEN